MGPVDPKDVIYMKHLHLMSFTFGRCHLHLAQVALNKLVVEKTVTSFYLISDHNRVRVWRPRSGHLNPAFVLQRHTAPTAGIMVWDAGRLQYMVIPPVLIQGTMTAQWYVHGILQPHVLPLMQRLPGAIFQQDNARPHTARVS
ncbi:transposable element Tcb2 transposase [Trichonephila clavipes]|nr:transposable element Tcb2 transposase [Trichonephila clavipes]